MHTSSINRIWATRELGKGWIEANPDSNMGRYVNISGGIATGDGRQLDAADLSLEDGFNERNESRELQERWGYKCRVYALEVEAFHTYYVGQHGIWVDDGTAPVAAGP